MISASKHIFLHLLLQGRTLSCFGHLLTGASVLSPASQPYFNRQGGKQTKRGGKMVEVSRLKAKATRRALESRGLAVPRNQKPVLRGYLYKQEVDNSETAPKIHHWERVFCVLYDAVLAYYRSKEAAENASKAIDLITLSGDFLVRKVKPASKSAKPSKYKDKDDRIDKHKKEMFLLTDLEHTNHYFATSSADVKSKWVERLQGVFATHQEKQQNKRVKTKRKQAYKAQVAMLRSLAQSTSLSTGPGSGYQKRKSKPYVEGLGMTTKERRQLNEFNEEKEKDLENLYLLKEGWKEEALMLRQQLNEAGGKHQKKKKQLLEYSQSVRKLVNHSDLQALEAEKQKLKVKELKRRLRTLKVGEAEAVLRSSSSDHSLDNIGEGDSTEVDYSHYLSETDSDVDRHGFLESERNKKQVAVSGSETSTDITSRRFGSRSSQSRSSICRGREKRKGTSHCNRSSASSRSLSSCNRFKFISSERRAERLAKPDKEHRRRAYYYS